MDSTITVVESQPDWLTVGTPLRPPDCALYRAAERLTYTEWWLGNRDQQYNEHGYRMLQCGRAHLGTGTNGTLVKLSGDLAAEELNSILPLASRVTRLDVAVTVQFPQEHTTLAEEYYDAYEAAPPKGHVKAKSRLEKHSDKSATFYIGTRLSDYYFRAYNKWRESHDQHYLNCWRFELQCNRAAAARLAPDCAGSADRPAWCQALVHDYISDHGLAPVFPAVGGRVLRAGFRRRSDADSRLRWIGTRVVPTLNWLKAAGYGPELERALAGDAYPIPTNL